MALGSLQAHFHRFLVLLCCADVPVVEGDRPEGGDVQPSGLFVEEKSYHVAARGDIQQTAVLHRLRCEKINVRGFDSHT